MRVLLSFCLFYEKKIRSIYINYPPFTKTTHPLSHLLFSLLRFTYSHLLPKITGHHPHLRRQTKRDTPLATILHFIFSLFSTLNITSPSTSSTPRHHRHLHHTVDTFPECGTTPTTPITFPDLRHHHLHHSYLVFL